MGKLNINDVFGGVWTTVKKHSPEILTGIGVAGAITSTVLAVKATPKALALIEEKKEEAEVDKLTPVDLVKTTWKCYIPAAATGTASVMCIIGACSVNVRRNAALLAAYALSDSTLREYKEKVVETFGEEKEREVRDNIAKSRIESNPVSEQEVIITNMGNSLCYDILSGRYFYSSADKIKRACNMVNERMLNQEYISLNDFYEEIGLDHTKLGEDLGWNISQGLFTVEFSTQLTDNEVPCLVIDYDRMPIYNFDRTWM